MSWSCSAGANSASITFQDPAAETICEVSQRFGYAKYGSFMRLGLPELSLLAGPRWSCI